MSDTATQLDAHDRLALLVDGYLDAALSDAEHDELTAALLADPATRDRFVDLLIGDRALRESHRSSSEHATLNAEPQASSSTHPGSPPRTPTLSPPVRGRAKRLVFPALPLAAAAALLLAAAAVAIYVFASNSKPETRNPKPDSPIATILDTSAGSTLLVNDAVANPGDEVRTGDIALDTGSADFRQTNGVAVTLRGRTRLTVHDAMSATLTRGEASFDCPPAAVGYTVHLPGGARVVDLGTAFTVTAADDRAPLIVTVTQGAVEVRDASDAPLTLTADQSAVAVADPTTGTTRFRRVDPMLRHDPAVAAVVRSDGPFTVGSLIEVGGEPLWLTHLGVQDAGPAGPADDGFHTSDPIPVGLWDESGERLLASVKVPGDAPRIAGWRYAAIAGEPVRLDPNTRYRIGALAGAGVEWFLDADHTSAFSAGPGLRLVDACYHAGSFAAPMRPGLRAAGRWGAANAVTVPADPDSTPAAERRAQEKDNETDPSQETEP